MDLFNPAIKAMLPLVPKPLVWQFARSYIAGEKMSDLVNIVKDLNGAGFLAATSILGEFVHKGIQAEAASEEYQDVLTTINNLGLDSYVHIKLTHLGLKLDKELCFANVKAVLKTADECNNFVRIDMEDSTCIDDTIAIYKRARSEFENVGMVIQACMRRSLNDIQALKGIQANIRLCKGIYIEPREIAFHDRQNIRNNYEALLRELLSAGCYVGIATHDPWLVEATFQLIEQFRLSPSQCEFQMLYGVESDLRQSIRDKGHRLRIAVPFGPNWYPYSIRRLRKNPTIAKHVLKALFKKYRS
ncbi:MAG: proline dehydrogenase family protein [Candidatus Marinimicrobia bacterium]|nr:proline dehydrogenase family protein [Candidatus Neomarinimicrobiota bacterium]